MNDNQFRQLLDHFCLSWDAYRKVKKGVKKRINRHMQDLGCRTLQAYMRALEESSEARQHCKYLMTISISRFFRDADLWHAIETEVIPRIVRANRGSVKVWSAGCACGEEPYSMRILWETMGWSKYFPGIEIWATDMNPDYLRRAQAGIYPRSSLREVPEALRAVFFRPVQKRQRYAIAEALKNDIVWRQHNLLSDPPLGPFHVIFLRNSLLTYYKQTLKVPAFQQVVDSMGQGGFLIIGAREKIPADTRGLLMLSSHPCIFQKASREECK